MFFSTRLLKFRGFFSPSQGLPKSRWARSPQRGGHSGSLRGRDKRKPKDALAGLSELTMLTGYLGATHGAGSGLAGNIQISAARRNVPSALR